MKIWVHIDIVFWLSDWEQDYSIHLHLYIPFGAEPNLSGGSLGGKRKPGSDGTGKVTLTVNDSFSTAY